MSEKIIRLSEASPGIPLRIVDILGGHGVRRRLLCLGFHKGDLVERNSGAIFGGPLLVKNLSNDTTIALGRGIAQKILVEVIDGQT